MKIVKLIFLGEGGTGKTYLIKTMSKWVQKILLQAGKEKLKVILLAYTGVAASLIGKSLINLQNNAFYSTN